MPIDLGKARQILDNAFSEIEAGYLRGAEPETAPTLTTDIAALFASSTQAYREVLLGCTIVRILDKSVNIRHPYTDQSTNAFSGRTLDERVINPFLQSKRIPCSKGPYLSVFRRSIKFDKKTRTGLRDVKGYDAFLKLVAHLESTSSDTDLMTFLRYVLLRFVQLREAAAISLSKLQRISLEQYDELISGLLAKPSGGRFPVLLVVAAFRSIMSSSRWLGKYLGRASTLQTPLAAQAVT